MPPLIRESGASVESIARQMTMSFCWGGVGLLNVGPLVGYRGHPAIIAAIIMTPDSAVSAVCRHMLIHHNHIRPHVNRQRASQSAMSRPEKQNPPQLHYNEKVSLCDRM